MTTTTVPQTQVRYYTEGDPYFFTVDNRPLTDLASNIAAVVSAITEGLSIASGPASSRPAAPTVGYPYLDTNLGMPIWCLSANPVVWVNASGTVV